MLRLWCTLQHFDAKANNKWAYPMDANTLTCMTIQRHTDMMSLNSSSNKTSEKKRKNNRKWLSKRRNFTQNATKVENKMMSKKNVTSILHHLELLLECSVHFKFVCFVERVRRTVRFVAYLLFAPTSNANAIFRAYTVCQRLVHDKRFIS